MHYAIIKANVLFMHYNCSDLDEESLFLKTPNEITSFILSLQVIYFFVQKTGIKPISLSFLCHSLPAILKDATFLKK